MSDDELRALERRYKESGSRDDWVRWLRARVRAGALSLDAPPLLEGIEHGTLTRDHIQLAGYCGDPLALELDEHEIIARATQLGDLAAVRVVLSSPEAVAQDDLLVWQRGLTRWGPQAVVLALCGCARHAIDHHEWSSPADDPGPLVVAEAARFFGPALSWAHEPNAEHAGRAQAALEAAAGYLWSYPAVLAASRAAQAAVAAQAGEDVSGHLDERLLYRPEHTLAAIRAELVPWALGRERVD